MQLMNRCNTFITKNLNSYRTTKLLLAIDTPLCLTEHVHNMINFSSNNYSCWNYDHVPFPVFIPSKTSVQADGKPQ